MEFQNKAQSCEAIKQKLKGFLCGDAAVPVVATSYRGCVFWPPVLPYSFTLYCVLALRPAMTVERVSPDKVRPIACDGADASLTSTIKLSKVFFPVCHDRENLSEVTLEMTSLDRSGSSATEGKNTRFLLTKLNSFKDRNY